MALDLKKWAREHSYQLSQMLDDGESVVGKLKDAKEQINTFGSETLVYFIDTPQGIKQLSSSSARVANDFAKINRKNFVKITRFVEEKTGKTRYWGIEEVMDAEGKIKAEEAKEMEKEMAG